MKKGIVRWTAVSMAFASMLLAPVYAESSSALEAVQACVLKKLRPGENLGSLPSVNSGERFVLAFRISKPADVAFTSDHLHLYDPNRILKGYSIDGPLSIAPNSPTADFSFVAMKSETLGIVFTIAPSQSSTGNSSVFAMEIDRKKPEGGRETGHTYYGYCKFFTNPDVSEVDAAFESVKRQPKAIR